MRLERIDMVAHNISAANDIANQALGVWYTGTSDLDAIKRNMEYVVERLEKALNALGLEINAQKEAA